jgi:glycosyltransferase involved in cell wall biosynthesis
LKRTPASAPILFVSHDATRTGAPIVLLHLLRWLQSHSARPFGVIVRGPGDLTSEFMSVAETLVLHDSSPPSTLKRLKQRLSQQTPVPASWRNRKWGLLYSNTVTNGMFVNSLRLNGLPVITHVHELRYWIERSGRTNWNAVTDQSSHFIAASNAVRQTLTQDYAIPAGLIDVVHEFVAASAAAMPHKSGDLRKAFGIPADAFVVGASGHETWRKGKDLFVQLAATVKRNNPGDNVHFVWVGDRGAEGEQYQLNHDVQLAEVADRVHWTGVVDDPLPYFSDFDAFAMVSREDPFPLVCLEAALLQTPLLCFAGAGGVPELVDDDAGFVVPYLDVGAMAERLSILLRDSALKDRLGMRARSKVIERHTADHAGPRVLEIIETQIERSAHRPRST